MSVRIISLLEADILNSSGRDLILEDLLSAIAKRPLWGYGLAGDMGLIGHYAHNIIVEMWVSFGVIFGSLLFLMIIYILVRGYQKALNADTKKFILLLVCSSFLRLFLSGTFLNEELLFFLFGVCISQIRLKGNMEVDN